MVKFKKVKFWDVFWVVAILLVLFTPVGFHARVLVGKLISFSPKVTEVGERPKLDDYSWQLQAMDGNSINFKEFKGEVVFVNFWATWCPSCVAEMSSLSELYKAYGHKVNFIFLANDKQQKVQGYLERKGMELPVYFSRGKEPKLLNSSTIPATYIIDAAGNIVVSKKGVADWNSKKVHEVLDALLPKS